ncbi:MAG TPA: DUF4192 domain-containing protein, partial [Actinophytocola sp.]|uniref:DUF4192 domain-containing protein n=1 Tax=Actinophytocola sp. TaxID=1872138 RepID=UPI002DBE9A19
APAAPTDPPGPTDARADDVPAPALDQPDDALDQPDDTVDLPDDTIARLLHALSHPEVREACLALCLTARAAPAERLWARLTRAAPTQVRAHPAALLATCAYLRGEGALAGVAADIALAATPDHRLAQIVRDVMDHGLPPHRFRAMLAESFVTAFTNT